MIEGKYQNHFWISHPFQEEKGGNHLVATHILWMPNQPLPDGIDPSTIDLSIYDEKTIAEPRLLIWPEGPVKFKYDDMKTWDTDKSPEDILRSTVNSGLYPFTAAITIYFVDGGGRCKVYFNSDEDMNTFTLVCR